MKTFLLIVFSVLLQKIVASPVDHMSVEEKIGQLFIIPLSPKHDPYDVIEKYHIGGVILKGDDLIAQMKCLQALQKTVKIPLLCCVDAENGLAQRIPGVCQFPKNLTLGAINDCELIYELGKEMGRQCNIIGAHVNFAPVVDVNSNPKNPIIHMRAFGDDPTKVAKFGELIMQGLHDRGVLSACKHFPGHGDVSIDSHIALPIAKLDKNALYPFKHLVEKGVHGVMSAHLALPEISDLPASLSPKVLQDILLGEMGFEGLIFSDALNMKALSKHFSDEEIAVLAFDAGTSCLLYGDHIAPNIEKILHESLPKAFFALKNAFISGRLSLKTLDQRVLKILEKKKMQATIIDPETIYDRLNTDDAYQLKKRLYRAAITLYQDPKGLIPIKDFKTKVIHLKDVSEEMEDWIANQKDLVIVLYGSPYLIPKIRGDHTILVAYEDDPACFEAALEVLSGSCLAEGKLPVHLPLN
ncbi:MAG: hypothetical protein KAR79_01515 [Simkaniaceae bacterium]|nr:hypothetical protein [Simkaniaceae bacterium]